MSGMYNTLLAGSPLWQEELATLTQTKRQADMPYPPDLPAAFDGTDVWHAYIPGLPRQCDCGASWAFATTMALNIRLRLWTHNKVRGPDDRFLQLTAGKTAACHWGSIAEYNILRKAVEELTPLKFAQADMYDAAPAVSCDGKETLIGGWQYLVRFGAFAAPCVSNADFGICESEQPDCRAVVGPQFGRCADGSAALTFRAGAFYVLPNDVDTIKAELFKWGPLPSAMEVYPDFVAWDGQGVYEWDGQGTALGGHAVVLMGWGTSVGVPYWIAMNWRGRDWGRQGYFYIRRGADQCGIESNVVSGMPALPLAKKHMTWTAMQSEADTFLSNVWPVHSTGYKLSAIEDALQTQGRDITAGRLDLYTEDMVPDYQSMVAGRPATIVFPYNRNIWRNLPDVFWLMLLYLGLILLVLGLVFS